VEVFLPLLERLGIPLSFLAIAIVAFVRGDISPRYVVQRLQADLDRERRETDRFLDMCIRLLEDARDSQHIGKEAVRAMKDFREGRGNGEDHDRRQQSILDRGERMHQSDVKER
jgi:hypothetical protein